MNQTDFIDHPYDIEYLRAYSDKIVKLRLQPATFYNPYDLEAVADIASIIQSTTADKSLSSTLPKKRYKITL